MHLACDFGVADRGDLLLHEEEEVFKAAVVLRGANLVQVESVERANALCCLGVRHDLLAGEHQSVGVFNFDQGIEKVAFRIGEDLGQNGIAIDWRGEGRCELAGTLAGLRHSVLF